MLIVVIANLSVAIPRKCTDVERSCYVRHCSELVYMTKI